MSHVLSGDANGLLYIILLALPALLEGDASMLATQLLSAAANAAQKSIKVVSSSRVMENR